MKFEQNACHRDIKTLLPGYIALFEEMLGRGNCLRVRVTGRSMQPFLEDQEIISVKKVPASSLRMGDLILFKTRQDTLVLHRIIKKICVDKNNVFFQTKGDALRAADEPVHQNAVLGKVCGIEKAGFFGRVRKINMDSFPQRTGNLLPVFVYQLNVSLDRIKGLAYQVLVPGVNRKVP